MSLPLEFSFDGAAVRVVMVSGDPWWVASDVAIALEYREAERMTRMLDDDEKGPHIVGTLGGEQRVTIISESGLYSAILRSRKASAKRFKKWVTAEVLPSIRKHGAYVMPSASAEPEGPVMAPNVEADQIVSAGRVFRALFATGRSMGMTRRLAATRANSAAVRSTGIDLAAELGASEWLEGKDLPGPQQRHYELQQNLRAHLTANNWPQGFGTQQLIEALGLPSDKPTQIALGHCLQLLGYKRTRLAAPERGGIRPWGYVLASPVPAGSSVA